jgi:hypothetical protein
MNEIFMRPLNRNGYYFMTDDTVDQMQTGKSLIKNGFEYELHQSEAHYHGLFFDELDRAGIKYKRIKGGWKLFI